MALYDVLAQAGDGQDFIVEIPAGTLGTPTDLLTGAGSDEFLLLETPLASGGTSIFVISD